MLGSDEKKDFLKRISRAICERFLEKASKVCYTTLVLENMLENNRKIMNVSRDYIFKFFVFFINNTNRIMDVVTT